MMVKKLKHLLIRKDQWSLLFRSLIYTLLLGGFALQGSVVWAVFLVLTNLLFYFLESGEKKEFVTSYTLITLLPLFALSLLPSVYFSAQSLVLIKIASTLVIGFVYWALLGLINFSFEKRDFVFSLLNTFILILVFVSAIGSMEPFSMGWESIILFLVLFMVFREVLSFHNIARSEFSLSKDKKSLITSMVMGLVGVQIVWFVLVLPLSVVNSAVLMVLFFVFGRDLTIAHYKGNLNLSFILREATFLILLVIIIFAASNWSI